MALDRKKLGKRALTALFGMVALGILILLLPKWSFHLALIGFGFVGILEFEQMAKALDLRLFRWPILLVLVWGVGSLYVPWMKLSWLPYLGCAATVLVSILPHQSVTSSLQQVGITLTAGIYLSLTFIPIAYIFAIEDGSGERVGRMLTTFCVLMVWGGDSLAYLAGSLFGKQKIAPSISPNKTYAGTAANLLGNFAVLLIAKYSWIPQLTLADCLVLALVFGILGFSGDLVESSWKRATRIKDSGRLFPGHGGIMDRIDSFFLTAPIFYFYMKAWVLGLS